MSESVEKCARCALPLIGPVFQVHVECAELPPKRPQLRLCQPCMESLNRWLHQRQTAARTPVEPRHADGNDEPREHSRRRFAQSLELREELVNRRELAKTWKSVLIVGIAVIAAILVMAYFTIS